MSVFECRRCKYTQDERWETICPQCKGFYRSREIGTKSNEQKGLASFAAAAQSHGTTFIPSGLVGFDRVMGGGFVAGNLVLLGGFHGAGKSRLLCLLADAVTKSKGGVLYASSEQDENGVFSIAKSLGLNSEEVKVVGNQYWIERTLSLVEKIKPFLVIYDSLQKFGSENAGGSPGSISQVKAITNAILKYCRKTKTCAVLVNQMDKGGQLKGATDASHDVDTVLVLHYAGDDDLEKPDIDRVRVLTCEKNRNGDEGLKSYWKMHGESDPQPGMLECVPPKSRLMEGNRGKYMRKRDRD